MHNQYFQKSNPIEKQIKELFDLNIKAIQNFRMFNPTELLSTRNPEEFFEKNVELLIQNGHKTLDYMENIFNIMENNWLNMTQDALKNVHKTATESEQMARDNLSNMFEGQKKAGSFATKSTSLEKKRPKKTKSTSVAKKMLSESSSRNVAKKSVAAKTRTKKLAGLKLAAASSTHKKSASRPLGKKKLSAV